ncbi:unnamed protein product [Callosobruchus maculatus]|uniref:Major facilitator superfamily (MFS) profile domain-containing protein n=1 Tax=Callosobruchus maculatus TaxID=64391 RepID=A0A653CC84_CALMS|nr:unnamed protein product [Callosobruchus maculatus]
MVEECAVQPLTRNGVQRGARKDEGPADGGSRAWAVMLGSFFCNGILFGVINSYGVLYKEFVDNLQKNNVTNASGKAALVGSFAMGTTFFVSPVSGVLTDWIGIRQTTFLGGAFASTGMLLSSFFADDVAALCVTYGAMYGLGGALAYTPSLAVLGHYFGRYLGVVNGFVTAGSSAFTIAMPYFMDALIQYTGIVWTLRILAAISGLIMLCAFLFKPVRLTTGPTKRPTLRDAFNMEVITNARYVVWTLGIAISLFGYFVPYVYMLKFVEANFDEGSDTKLPILCIGVTSGLGRLLFGYIADMKGVNRIYLQQLSFFSIGMLTILLPFSAGYYGWLVVITLGMGIFDGCFISLLGPIAFDLCGRQGATQAIGMLLGVCSIPLTIGPYIAGVLLDARGGDYQLPLLLAGIPPLVGAAAMFSIKCVSADKKVIVQNGNTTYSKPTNHFNVRHDDDKEPKKNFEEDGD